MVLGWSLQQQRGLASSARERSVVTSAAFRPGAATAAAVPPGRAQGQRLRSAAPYLYRSGSSSGGSSGSSSGGSGRSGSSGRGSRPAAKATTIADSEGAFISAQAVQEGYNAADNAAYWETRPAPVIARCLRIGAEVARWRLLSSGAGQVLRGSSGGGPGAGPALLLASLIRLGPAFVKIGQALSSRPDVLPPAYLDELEKLQDRIPAFSNDEAFKVIEEELGRPVAATFSRISADPVAAASLGQVYRATLADGREVAVKVQRPGVVEMIAMDVFILRYIAEVLRRVAKLNTDLPSLVDEWATSLFKELDYNREAANAKRFKSLFARMPEVYVPEIYTEYTTTKVLTMEWVDGERLRTASSANGVAAATAAPGGSGAGRGGGGSAEDLVLVEVGVRCSLEQMLEEGFYHADPHPGNLLKMPDGRLAYLDFGMMGSIDLPVRQALVRATLHLVNREFGPLADDIVALGFLPPGSDRSQIVPALTGVFQQALANGVSNLSFGDLSTNLGRTMYKFKFRVPPYYTLLVRSLTVLEGIALASDRNYKVLSAAYPWVARRLLTDRSPELHSTLRALLYSDEGRFQFTRLASLLEQSAKVKALGKMRGPSTSSSPLKLLLSPDGEFVRGIVLDEVAKGIDAALRLTFDASVDSARRAVQSAPTLLGLPLLLPYSQQRQLPVSALRGPAQLGPSHAASSTGRAAAVAPLTFTELVSAGGLLLSAPGFELWGNVGGRVSATTALGTAGRAKLVPASFPSSPSPVSESLVSLLRAVPKLASAEDKEQIDGLSRLASAMYSIAASQRSTGGTNDGSSGAAASGGSSSTAIVGMPAAAAAALSAVPASLLPLLPEPAASQIQQAASFFEWLGAEISGLPQEQREQALMIPLQLLDRVTSRMIARAIRNAMLTPGVPEESP